MPRFKTIFKPGFDEFLPVLQNLLQNVLPQAVPQAVRPPEPSPASGLGNHAQMSPGVSGDKRIKVNALVGSGSSRRAARSAVAGRSRTTVSSAARRAAVEPAVAPNVPPTSEPKCLRRSVVSSSVTIRPARVGAGMPWWARRAGLIRMSARSR